ncbi:MAG: DEAD/DEAH box helicase [Bacillota bacterium]
MFSDFRLGPVLLDNVRKAGYIKPTPVQSSAIPPALEGRDIVVTAETGSGKTAAFLLPMLERVSTGPRGGVRGLILCPTREIAIQTAQHARKLGRHTGMNGAAIYGGVGYEPQLQALRAGVDIVVATPGRLLDHLGRGTIDLKNVSTLVLDEADRMFDMGFLPDLRRIMSHLPASRQTLLYSATMPPEILALAERFMKAPVRLEVGRVATPPETVSQAVYMVPSARKTTALLELVQRQPMESVLVFTRTKHRADRLARRLSWSGVKAACIHGDRSQRQREAALEGYRQGVFRVLVATDIAARGLDIQGVTHVINYDLPAVPEDYIHRVGRTARAGATGQALSLVTGDDAAALQGIERALGHRLRRLEWNA